MQGSQIKSLQAIQNRMERSESLTVQVTHVSGDIKRPWSMPLPIRQKYVATDSDYMQLDVVGPEFPPWSALGFLVVVDGVEC